MSGYGMPSSLILACSVTILAPFIALAQPPSYNSDPFGFSLVRPFQVNNWMPVGKPKFNDQVAILTTRSFSGPQAAALWNPNPFPYKNNFNITLRTRIGFDPNEIEKNAKGLALWLIEKPADRPLGELGPVYGSRDYFRGLGIVFDTIDDDNRRNNPSISAHYLNGTVAYPHHNDGLSTQLAGCVADYRRPNNDVSTQVSYNGTHLSVYVDLTGNNQYRKCLMVPLQMRMDSDVYLGVSAETIDNGKEQETHEIVKLEVSGTPDWSRQKPPSVANPAWQFDQQKQPQQQSAWQQQPPSQWQQQQAKSAQAPPSWAETPDDATTLHDKIDHLVKATTHTALESAQAGEALKEVQTNVLQKIQQATNAIMSQLRRVDQSMATHVSTTATQVDALNKLIESTKGSVDAGRVDTERRSNAIDAQIAGLQTSVKDMNEVLQRVSKSFQAQISREIGKGTARMAAAASKSSSAWWGGWFYFVMFQIIFVAFLIFRHVTNKKLDKLL